VKKPPLNYYKKQQINRNNQKKQKQSEKNWSFTSSRPPLSYIENPAFLFFVLGFYDAV
jgi:hypothetical protein